jgi:cell wall-associated NlpC family hydrolase
VTGLLLLAVLALTVGPSASAEPKAITQTKSEVSALRTRVYQLNSQLELLVEKYDADNIRLAQAKTDVAQNQARLKEAEQSLAQAQATMSGRLVEIYERGGVGNFLDVLVSATSWSDFVDRLVFLESISSQDSQLVAQVSIHKKQVADQQVQLAQQLKKQKAAAAQVLASRKSVTRKIAQNQQLLKGKEQQIAAMEKQWQAEQAKLAAEAKVAAARSKGIRVVEAAMKYRGVPYVWGGAGPGGFDCSGLVMYVFAELGVSLPHSAAMQYDSGTHVSRDQLEAGDLVFFGNPIHHVGIYVGNGDMIDAPYSGVSVRIDPLQSDYTGATRIF